ncbi:MAG: RNA ligase RtcB family protein [Proteobacteria bacterium]|nr:MAG: RNA ligase RtcB family protein [Pseudomonadota bacterium]
MGNEPFVPKISIIASADSWIEGEAVRQLEHTATWPGMIEVTGMPDLHPGRGSPIGASFLSKGWIYPSLVGNDIGCGMGLWQIDLLARRVKMDRLEAILAAFESEPSGRVEEWLEKWNLKPNTHDLALGTIGGGNHFAELQKVEKIVDQSAWNRNDLDKERVFLLAHSGSRGLGEEILRGHSAVHGASGLLGTSDEATKYMAKHDVAVRWAEANRARIAGRVIELLGTEGRRVSDICHNHVVPHSGNDSDLWLHRKGATPANPGLIVIPGSRGDFSYLVEVSGDPGLHGYSLPHGAGRKWKRSDCRGRLEKRFSVESLRRTSLGGRVICSDKELVYEEAPQAYKKIEQVIEDMASRDFIKIIATLRPIITFKKG